MNEWEETVALVLQRYMLESGCPCRYRPFIYWVGKDQGPGWQDNVQNSLVNAALELECFERTKTGYGTYGYEGSWRCLNCGAIWHHISVEWRMLAFHEKLLKSGEPEPGGLYPKLISRSIASTVGFEPSLRDSLSPEQWTAFMAGRSPKEDS